MKELRLRGVSDREHGNAYLPEFMADYNCRFARAPLNPRDAHRPLLAHENLARVFTWQEDRRLTDNLTFDYKRVMYIVEASAAAEAARGNCVAVIESEDGTVRLEYCGRAARGSPVSQRFATAAEAKPEPVGSAGEGLNSARR